jgi:hypothetical protein
LCTIIPGDWVAHNEAAVSMLEKLVKDNKFLMKAIFSDEAAFHFSRKVNI